MIEPRATTPGAKVARKQQMLAAAADLLEGWSYSDITMDRIAKRAGIAKGTLYLYFRTKEALFLSLYEERLNGWYSQMQALADRSEGTVDAASAARVVSSSLASEPTLIYLHGLLYSTLSHNIDLETTVAFRRRQSERISVLSRALAGRIEGLSFDRAVRFLIRLEVIVGGLSWAAQPPSALAQALEEDDLALFRLDFEEELREIATALLK